MCGIVALISPGVPIREDLLSAMRDRLRHRGPDNGANWIAPDGRVGLGHRRLSIIDTSHAADQPMLADRGRLVLIFNGEIYNYVELRAELQSLGSTFSTRSDTEVLLEALRVWGEQALSRLNGMFALVLWNTETRTMLIARDRFGEKPLFIGRGAFGTVGFASEIKGLTAHPLIPCRIDTAAVGRFGLGQWLEDDTKTFFEGVERFPPAHAAVYGPDGVERRRWRYWTPDYTRIDEGIRPRDAVDRFAELLHRSVSMRLRADVPVGSSLSGGLDSSVLVGLLAKERQVSAFRQNTFSACFPSDPTISEDREIRAVVEATGVNSFLVTPDPRRLADECALLHWHQEEPFLSASIYLQWCVARLARQHDTTVLLDGQGADELLGGYQFYFPQYQMDLVDRGRMDQALRETAKFTRRLAAASTRFAGVHRRFNPGIALTPEALAAHERAPSSVYHRPYLDGTAPASPGYRLRRTLSEALQHNSLPMLLRYADRNSMAFSRECRLPYLDHDLVDFCIGLPDGYYVRNGWQKWVLRQAAGATIPREIRWRADKVGYAAPLDLWLRGELHDWGLERIMDDALSGVPGFDRMAIESLWEEHQDGQANHSWAIWRWISLSEWLALFRGGSWRAGSMHHASPI